MNRLGKLGFWAMCGLLVLLAIADVAYHVKNIIQLPSNASIVWHVVHSLWLGFTPQALIFLAIAGAILLASIYEKWLPYAQELWAIALLRPRPGTLVGKLRTITSRESRDVSGTSLPITITAIARPAYARYSGLPTKVRFVQDGKPAKEIEVDSPKLTINEVFISNASLNRAVTLRIALSITDSRGSTHKLSGEGKNRWGALLGQDDVETVSSRLRGQQPPPRVVSPVTIAPQTTVRGSLSFIIDTFSGGDDPFDLEVLRYYISGFVGKPEELFKFSLEIEDVISGTSISIPLPSDGYKGRVDP